MYCQITLTPEAESKLHPVAYGPDPLVLVEEGRSGHDATLPSPYDVRTRNLDGSWGYYYDRSLTKFDELVKEHSVRQPTWLVKGIHTSLMSLHATRCDRNFQAYQAYLQYNQDMGIAEETSQLWDSALVGTASKLKLLQLHQQTPGLPSLEIAKQSHPFDWDTSEMDAAVTDAIKDHDVQKEWLYGPENCRYAFYRVLLDESGTPTGLIFVRKQNVVSLGDAAMVVKRSTFVMRLDKELPQELERLVEAFKKQVPNEQQRDKLKERIVAQILATGREDRALEFLARVGAQTYVPGYADVLSRYLAEESNVLEDGIDERADWLVPVASSFYVSTVQKPETAKNNDGKNYYLARQAGTLALTNQ